ATPSNAVACVRRSWKSAGAHGKRVTFRFLRSSQTCTSRSGWRYGSGCSSTAFVTLKIATVAPMPSASVAIAVSANAGFLRNVRAAKIRSDQNASMLRPSGKSTLLTDGWSGCAKAVPAILQDSDRLHGRDLSDLEEG